eukprot:936208-Pyramimonas_sp.AAC.2
MVDAWRILFFSGFYSGAHLVRRFIAFVHVPAQLLLLRTIRSTPSTMRSTRPAERARDPNQGSTRTACDARKEFTRELNSRVTRWLNRVLTVPFGPDLVPAGQVESAPVRTNMSRNQLRAPHLLI